MLTFQNCDLSKCQNNLPNVAIRNSIQTDDSFPISSFCVPDISKTNKVRNLKQSPKVAHICHVYPE